MAKEFFTKLNDYKAPRDKLLCLQNGCKVLCRCLDDGRKPTGADDLLALLVYVLIQVNPHNLWSNLE